MPALIETLHDIIPLHGANFMWSDRNGDIVNACTDMPSVQESAALYFSEFYKNPKFDTTPNFQQLMLRGCHGIGIVPVFQDSSLLYKADVYHAIFKPSGIHRLLDLSLAEPGYPIGSFALCRSQCHKPFSNEEKRMLAKLVPYLVHGFQAKSDRKAHGPFVESGAQGLIVADETARIRYCSPEGIIVLHMAIHPDIDFGNMAIATPLYLPPALEQMCRDFRQIFSGETAPPPIVRHENPWGRFEFRAYWLDSTQEERQGLIGIVAERQEPLRLRLVRAMRTLPLSPTQQEVCLRVAEGSTHTEIARDLHVRASTVKDHVRKIYEKFDVHNREELLAYLFAQLRDDRH